MLDKEAWVMVLLGNLLKIHDFKKVKFLPVSLYDTKGLKRVSY